MESILRNALHILSAIYCDFCVPWPMCSVLHHHARKMLKLLVQCVSPVGRLDVRGCVAYLIEHRPDLYRLVLRRHCIITTSHAAKAITARMPRVCLIIAGHWTTAYHATTLSSALTLITPSSDVLRNCFLYWPQPCCRSEAKHGMLLEDVVMEGLSWGTGESWLGRSDGRAMLQLGASV